MKKQVSMKRIGILYFLFTTVFFHCSLLKGQSTFRHITDYMFVNGCNESQYKREFLSDSIFVEKYFYQINKTSLDSEFVALDTFKVINRNWWYCLNGTYYPFFSTKMFKNKIITRRNYNPGSISGIFYNCSGYQPYKISKNNKKNLYVFKVNLDGCIKENFEKIDIAYMYFDPDIGFVKKKFWTCNMSEILILRERR